MDEESGSNTSNNNADENPYLNLLKSTEGNLKLLIIGGKSKYGDPRILHALDLQDFPEKIKVEKKKKMIDILELDVEFDVEYGDLKLSKVRSNRSNSLKNPNGAITKLFKNPQKMNAGDVSLRLILLEEEDEEINRPLILAKELDTFHVKICFVSGRDLSVTPVKPARLDRLTMEKDRDFFRQINENRNVPLYMSKLEYAKR
jgi:hypothetical protein